MASRLEEILKEREKKVENLKLMGIDLYPARSEKEAENREVVENFEKYEESKIVAGRPVMNLDALPFPARHLIKNEISLFFFSHSLI